MLVKCLEIRDRNTFIPVMCFRPIPENELQRYLLARDGWSCSENEHCVIVIDTHRNRAMHNPYEYPSNGARTLPLAHRYIEQHWHELHAARAGSTGGSGIAFVTLVALRTHRALARHQAELVRRHLSLFLLAARSD